MRSRTPTDVSQDEITFTKMMELGLKAEHKVRTYFLPGFFKPIIRGGVVQSVATVFSPAIAPLAWGGLATLSALITVAAAAVCIVSAFVGVLSRPFISVGFSNNAFDVAILMAKAAVAALWSAMVFSLWAVVSAPVQTISLLTRAYPTYQHIEKNGCCSSERDGTFVVVEEQESEGIEFH